MNAREYCMTHDSIAYASMLGGVEIKGILYGIHDCVYAVSNAWYGKKSYHCARVDVTASGRSYFRICNTRVYLDECIRMN